MRGAGRALALGIAWGLAWAPVAVIVGIGLIDRDNSMDEMWPAIGAYPGFISGVLFSILHGLTARGRSLGELPVSRAALLGAAAALPLALLPLLLDAAGDAPLWRLAGGFAAAVVLLAAISAVASVCVSRRLRRRRAAVEIGRRDSSHG